MAKLSGYAYCNGKIVDIAQVCIHPADQGFTLGHGLYETIRVERGKPFAFDSHYKRLSASARYFDLTIPQKDELTEAVTRLLAKNELSEARLRITLTGGVAPFPESAEEPTLVMTLTSPLPAYPESARILTAPFLKNEHSPLASHKSLSSSENLIALRFARSRGADEAVFFNTSGFLCEAASSNIFLIRGAEVLTPSLQSGCLPGTTREIVLQICEKEQIPYREHDLEKKDIQTARTFFLTSCTRRIQPVREFDDRKLSTESALLSKLQQCYDDWESSAD